MEVSLPPLSELQAITDNVEFRKRAMGLGVLTRVRKSDGSGWASRTKAEILGDYKRKLDESPAASAASEVAASCSSAFVSEALQAMTQGSAHDFVSVGSPSAQFDLAV